MNIPVTLVEGAPTKQFEKDVELAMDQHIKHFEKELLKVRTGRAHPSMIEDIRVSVYGSSMPLKEVAAVSAPDAALLVVQPWDKANMGEIEKALSNSDVGVTPQNDGNIIRIQLPKMSSSRREELTKVLLAKLEACKVAIRNVRKEVHNTLRETEKAKKISEDYGRRLSESLQKVTDKLIVVSDTIAVQKEREIKAL
ncbi:ribosome recycling factor [Candidatus Dependentiae bacterium]|nr:ribosome recycling factor [Candidatus Dependentiae bacterium]